MTNDNYEDIINLPHYEPKNHKRMTMENRAAQFGAFQALTGYEDAIIETGRETSKKYELTDEQINELNQKINRLNAKLDLQNEVTIVYYEADKLKSGGQYLTKRGIIKRIDLVNRFIKFNDNEKILIDNIYEIK